MPFTMNIPLGTLPSSQDDSMNSEMSVTRLLHKEGATGDQLPAHDCDMGDQADMKKCLNVERGCMWTTLTTADPLKRIQAVSSYCMPCMMDGEDIPCWNPGAWVNGKQ